MDEDNNIIDDVKEYVEVTKDKIQKNIREKFFDILKWVAILFIICICVSNLFINYSEGKLSTYNLEIIENRKELDSILSIIEESKKVQSVLDDEISDSEIKVLQYKIKLNKLVKEYGEIRKNVKNESIDYSFNVVTNHLDSIRSGN